MHRRRQTLGTLIELRAATPTPVHGFLAIDTFVGGAAHGGLRIADDVSADLLKDAARTMTLKYGFAHLPVGGAKAAIHAPLDVDREERHALLRSFGIALRPYLEQKVYVPGEDMGSSAEDIEILMAAAGLKRLPRSLMRAASGYFTGIGVCASTLAAAAHFGLQPADLRVVVEGFGAVGVSAASALYEHGARVVAISTTQGGLHNPKGLDIPRLIQERQRHGNEVVNREGFGDFVARQTLSSIDCNVFVPCAIMHSINMQRVPGFKAQLLVPGANVPCTADAERVLVERGVTVLPDFVANCGGVLGSSISRAGINREAVAPLVAQRLESEVAQLLQRVRESNLALRETATTLAMGRFEAAKASYERPSLPGRVFRFGVELHRRGLIPQPLMAPAARWYFGRRWTDQGR